MIAVRTLSSCLLSAAVAAQSLSWRFVDGPGDSARVGAMMSGRSRLALPGPGGTMWELEGSSLLARPTIGTGPSRRQLEAFAGDPESDTIYLFGGTSGPETFDELWSWDGRQWLDLTPVGASPPPRHSAQLAFDVARQRLVLYGGIDAAAMPRTDTWEFDGTAWQQIATATVPDPEGAGMVYDQQLQRCVLLTFPPGAGSLGRTWVWTGTDWALVDSAGMPSRDGIGMAYDASRNVTVALGGLPTADEIWEWNGSSWSMVGVLGVAQRTLAGVSYDPSLQAVRLYGGFGLFQFLPGLVFTNREFTDGWSWDGTNLQPLHGNLQPGRRIEAAFASDPATGELLVFGGVLAFPPFDETWVFDGTRWTRRLPTQSPPGLRGAAMVGDPARSEVMLFGGNDGNNYRDDTWIWNGTDWSVAAMAGPRPSARGYASLAVDDASGDLVLFGGLSGDPSVPANISQETWRWSGTAWTLVATTAAPSARTDAALTYDPMSGGMLLWGGVDPSAMPGELSDGWLLQGNVWQRVVTATTPPPLASPALVYDAGNQRMLLLGRDGAAGYHVWAFDGSDWSLVQVDASDDLNGRVIQSYASQQPVLWTSASLATLSATPAVGESLGGACGSPPVTLELRTLPAVGEGRFGFEARAASGDMVFFGLSDNVGNIPLFSCSVLLGSPLFTPSVVAGSDGFAALPLAIPADNALRGLDYFVHALAWNPAQPLSALRLSEAWRFVVGD